MEKICENCYHFDSSMKWQYPAKSDMGYCGGDWDGAPVFEDVSAKFGCIHFRTNCKKTCKNCAWWEVGNEELYSKEHNTCIHQRVDPNDAEDVKGELNTATVVVEPFIGDDFVLTKINNIMLYIETGPDFGCVHFESK